MAIRILKNDPFEGVPEAGVLRDHVISLSGSDGPYTADYSRSYLKGALNVMRGIPSRRNCVVYLTQALAPVRNSS